MSKVLATAFIFSALLLVHSGNTNWSYHEPNGPGTWKKHYPLCGGMRQSPVNIVPKQTIFDTGLEDFALNYEPVISVELENNGHSVQANFLTGRSNITGGGLPSSFQAVQMHFHWGSNYSRGSEHQMRGRSFPLEIHIVHYNVDKYANFTVAMRNDDGLAVLGILVGIQDKDNPIWNVIVNNLNKTLFKGDKTTLQSLRPLSFLPEVWTQYFAYRGSLTTPGCFESVHWIIFNNAVSISKAQLSTFRQLYVADRQSTKRIHLVDNFRPVQTLNEWPITRSFQRPLFPCAKISQVAMICSVLAGDKIVFYNVTVDICTVPVTVTLEVSQPDISYNFVDIVYQDIKQPMEIGNLRYGFILEMHSHHRETDSGYLYITVNQVYPLSTPNQREVISGNFNYSSCQLGKCTSDGRGKHWCDGTTIGYGNDTLNIGFSTIIDYTSSSESPLAAVIEFYRNETGSWHLSDTKTFGNDETKEIHLTETIVQGTNSELSTRSRRMIESSQWEYVNFTAMITKASDYVELQLFMTIPSNGLYYKVLKDKHPLRPGDVHPRRLSDGSKIAIGVSVVVLVVILVGVTLGILYRKRKQYVGHRPALVQQMDTHDDVITDNIL